MNTAVVLIIVLATSSSSQAGSTTVETRFSNEVQCTYAGETLVRQAEKRGGFVMTWGCFAGGVK